MTSVVTRLQAAGRKKVDGKSTTAGISVKTDENTGILGLKGIKKTTTVGAKRPVLSELTNHVKENPGKKTAAAKGVAVGVNKRVPLKSDASQAVVAATFHAPKPEPIEVEPSEPEELLEEVPLPVIEDAKVAEPMDVDLEEESDDDDIDKYDVDDPQFCTEYVPYIFDYWRKIEAQHAVLARYMEKQVDITEKHRTILVDWMAEVIVKFRLMSETMFLAVNIIDRFLQVKAVARQKLQLVGITAMLIASKFEEIYTPEVNDFIWITAKAYTREEVLKMERLILVTLDFNLSVATPLHFLRRFSKAARSDSRIHTLSKYITELSLLEYNLLEFLPSHVAAAAVYIARRMSGFSQSETWTRTLEKHAGYTEQQIMPCVLALNDIVLKQSKSKYKATYRKYACQKLLSVSETPAVEVFALPPH